MVKISKPKVSILRSSDNENWLQIEDKTFTVSKGYDLSPIYTAKFNDKGNIVVDRPRDFGGCGKDAVKMQKNVPINLWLREINARFQRIV